MDSRLTDLKKIVRQQPNQLLPPPPQQQLFRAQPHPMQTMSSWTTVSWQEDVRRERAGLWLWRPRLSFQRKKIFQHLQEDSQTENIIENDDQR